MGVVGGVPGGAVGGVLGRTSAKTGSFGTLAYDGANNNEPVSLAEAAESEIAGARGQELGDLFEYNLKEKVTILKNHSALVPIINSHIDAEKVTLWSSASRRALRALWIKNTSGLTLDSGTFNIIENDSFAGEGLVDSLKPDEKRLLSYAVDQGVRVEQKHEAEMKPITRIKIIHGVMYQTREERDHQVYSIRNANTDARQIIIEHPVRRGWKLTNGAKPEESSASYYRFRVQADPNTTTELKVDEVQPIQSTIALSNLSDEYIKILVSGTTLKPETIQALQKIVQQKNEIAGLDRQIKDRQTQISNIDQDQGRLRENMKALKGSAEEKALLQRYTRELNDQEDKLQAVRTEMASLEQRRSQSREQLDKMMQELTLDEAM